MTPALARVKLGGARARPSDTGPFASILPRPRPYPSRCLRCKLFRMSGQTTFLYAIGNERNFIFVNGNRAERLRPMLVRLDAATHERRKR